MALYTAASTSERIAFHTINRATGHRVHRHFVDSDTGRQVEKDDQLKGYKVSQGDYVILEPEEVTAAVPESDKTYRSLNLSCAATLMMSMSTSHIIWRRLTSPLKRRSR